MTWLIQSRGALLVMIHCSVRDRSASVAATPYSLSAFAVGTDLLPGKPLL